MPDRCSVSPCTNMGLRVVLGAIICVVPVLAGTITNVTDLVNAVNNGSTNQTILVGPGTFELPSPLRPKEGMTIRGAGIGKTVITGVSSWNPGESGLPEDPVGLGSVDRNAYLFDLGDGPNSVTISDMTLTGPNLRGAVFGDDADDLRLYNLHIEDFLWTGIRIFSADRAEVHDNVLHNAGGSYNNETAGAVFTVWVRDSEFWNNHIYRTSGGSFFGFKGRYGRNCRFHHNTIEVDFSLEFPFENDEYIEIDHNMCAGVISVPKHSGANVVDGGYSFHIHHNWFRQSYSLEGPRNSLYVDHNLFDFTTTWDIGNLLSCWNAGGTAPGPFVFNDNLIKNPGRGLAWISSGQNNITWHNNHVIANTTVSPRTDGFFAIEGGTDFSTVTIRDNIIECIGTQRPLMRQGYDANIENNTLIGITDTDRYENPSTGAPRGPLEKLSFTCGVRGEFTVDDWNVFDTPGSMMVRKVAPVPEFTTDGTVEVSIVDLRGRLIYRVVGNGGSTDLRRMISEARGKALAQGRYVIRVGAGDLEYTRVLTIVE